MPMVMEALRVAASPGGVPVAPEGSSPGALVTQPGQVQIGYTLTGAQSTIGWRNLTGWRDLPPVDRTDSLYPARHGAYAGRVYGQGLTVTYDCLVRGTPERKLEALRALEAATRLGGPLVGVVVDDGAGPSLRWGHVTARQVPMDMWFRHAPLQCTVQFVFPDPLRYELTENRRTVGLPSSEGGLVYPLDYSDGLDYGIVETGSAYVLNTGTAATAPTIELHGPLSRPTLSVGDKWVEFNLMIVSGDTITVDVNTGRVLLNGSADRLYTITPRSAPIESLMLQPGSTSVSLTAVSGSGNAVVRWRSASI